jgi:hypothetical protein
MLLGTIDVPYGTGPVSITYAQDKGFWDIATAAVPPQAAEKLMGALAMERIRQAPLRWLWLRVKEMPRFWLGSGDFISMHTAFKHTYRLGAVGFWGLALAGTFLARQRWRELYPLVLLPALPVLVHSIGSMDEGYSLALVPMAAIFAGHAVSIPVLKVRGYLGGFSKGRRG